MGLYKQLKNLNRNKESLVQLQRERMIQWRSETNIIRIEHPTNLISARRLGYKVKPGFILARIRFPRGGKQRPTVNKGRRSRNFGQRLVLKKSYQAVAEQRVANMFPNLEVLNSYKVGKDGLHYWFEVILVDPAHPVIKADPHMKWISSKKHTGRVYRGLTSAGRKSRGLLNKGKGAEKLRPSLGAHLRTGK
ncbi:50S ribosomal protein L15e [Candidatus Woesearchaeota archaeon]|nr:50S ribosomal protein L15e [Candidatus Woesearchaeota archaeon]